MITKSLTMDPILKKLKIRFLIVAVFMCAMTAFTSTPVTLKVTSDWGSGFNGNITVTNTTDVAFDDWEVSFDFPHNITSIWNAKIKSHSGNHYVIENVSWNGKLNPGQSTSFGFGGSPGNVDVDISNISVNGIDVSDDTNPPVANNNTATTEINSSIIIDVLDNDTDPAGKAIKLSSVSQPQNGVVEIFSDSSVKYTPESDFSGNDSFNYIIVNTDEKTASATVDVMVKDVSPSPDVNGFVYKVTSDWKSAFNANIILTNTTAKASEGWSVEFDFPYEISSVWGAETKSHTGNHYVLENLSWNSDIAPGNSVSIGFGASPGNAVEEPSNVKVNMNNGEDSSSETTPIANNNSIVTEQNTSGTVNVLANDSGSNIKLQSVTAPMHGVVTTSASSITYAPENGYVGNDTFNYSIVDSNGKTASATVTVIVNESSAPIAQNTTAFVYKNNTVEIDALANDKGNGLRISSLTNPDNGSATISGNKIYYTPNSNYSGSDKFNYIATDIAGLKTSASVFVTVGEQAALNKINATYWSVWGGNTSYNVDGRQIRSTPVDMDKIDPSYNVIITAFIVTDESGNYQLAYKNPGSTAPSFYTPEEVKSFINKTKAQGRKVIVSLGGQYFDMKMSTSEDVNFFVSQMKTIIDEYGFEGIDLDLEHNSLSTIDPELLANAVTQVVNNYRVNGENFWLTAAPEWGFIIPYSYGSGQWASHSLEGDFFVKIINDIGIDNFDYIWPQTYNQGPANGVTGPNGDKVSPSNGMDKFLSAMAWGITTQEGYAANGNMGVFIPSDKLCLGIPATEGAAGGAMTYVATPELIKSAWNLMLEHGGLVSGFMNWSVDWDAANIADGDLSDGYIHPSWSTGRAIAETLGSSSDIDSKPAVSIISPLNNSIIKQKVLSPVNISISANDADGTIVSTVISVDGNTYDEKLVNWTPSGFDTYTITAKAIDDNGNEKSEFVKVVIVKDETAGTGETGETGETGDGDTGETDEAGGTGGSGGSGGSGGAADNKEHPTLKFNTPFNNQVVQLESLTYIHIDVSADDQDGTLKNVSINVDGHVFNQKTVDWIPSDYGTFTIVAVAIDNDELLTTKTVVIEVQKLDSNTSRKQIVGYLSQWDTWKGTNHGFPAKGTCNQLNVDYSKYTILNFSFFGVAKDGSLHSGDYRNKNIYMPDEVQEPAEILHGDVYSSWDYWLLYGELDLLWEANEKATEAGFVVDGTSWYNVNTGLTGQMPIPMHKEGGAEGLIQLCKKNDVKLVATIGGWSMCKHIPEMAADPAKKERFLEDCRTLINMGFDGIDIDWEFPGPFPGMNYTGTEADFANFTALMRDLRETIGSDKLLTAAFHCSPERLDGYDWVELNRYMDYFNMMTYDMHGGWSQNTNHNSPLYGADLSWDTTFQYLTIEKNIPAYKINMGLGFYGRGLVTNGTASLGAPTVKKLVTFGTDGPALTASDFVNWGAFEGTPNYGYIMKNNEGWTYNWDDTAKVPYLTKDNYFLSFDNKVSIQHKADYVVDNNAGGVIVWHVFGDWDAGEVETTYGKKLPYCTTVRTPLLDILHYTFMSEGDISFL